MRKNLFWGLAAIIGVFLFSSCTKEETITAESSAEKQQLTEGMMTFERVVGDCQAATRTDVGPLRQAIQDIDGSADSGSGNQQVKAALLDLLRKIAGNFSGEHIYIKTWSSPDDVISGAMNLWTAFSTTSDGFVGHAENVYESSFRTDADTIYTVRLTASGNLSHNTGSFSVDSERQIIVMKDFEQLVSVTLGFSAGAESVLNPSGASLCSARRLTVEYRDLTVDATGEFVPDQPDNYVVVVSKGGQEMADIVCIQTRNGKTIAMDATIDLMGKAGIDIKVNNLARFAEQVAVLEAGKLTQGFSESECKEFVRLWKENATIVVSLAGTPFINLYAGYCPVGDAETRYKPAMMVSLVESPEDEYLVDELFEEYGIDIKELIKSLFANDDDEDDDDIDL